MQGRRGTKAVCLVVYFPAKWQVARREGRVTDLSPERLVAEVTMPRRG